MNRNFKYRHSPSFFHFSNVPQPFTNHFANQSHILCLVITTACVNDPSDMSMIVKFFEIFLFRTTYPMILNTLQSLYR